MDVIVLNGKSDDAEVNERSASSYALNRGPVIDDKEHIFMFSHTDPETVPAAVIRLKCVSELFSARTQACSEAWT